MFFCLFPAEYEMESKGTLEPTDRHGVYVLDRKQRGQRPLKVNHGDAVKAINCSCNSADETGKRDRQGQGELLEHAKGRIACDSIATCKTRRCAEASGLARRHRQTGKTQ